MEKRWEWGLELLHHIEQQLARADNKAQYTLVVDALLLVGLILIAPAGGRPVLHLLVFLATAALLVSIFFCLSVVMPKLNPPGLQVNLFYFSSILTVSEADFASRFRALTPEEVESMLLAELYVLSAITQGKFLKIRRSHIALYLGLGLWALAFLLR